MEESMTPPKLMTIQKDFTDIIVESIENKSNDATTDTLIKTLAGDSDAILDILMLIKNIEQTKLKINKN